jgi:hypothetical protein
VAGQTLTASTGTWSGTAPISYSYQWQLCNAGGGECANIAAATSSTYRLDAGDVGNRLQVVVTASNFVGSASDSSEATAVVRALGPANTTPPAISGTSKDGQTLSASTGSWEGTPPITYTYQWQSCDSLGEGCLDIAGATSSMYTLTPDDVGETIQVTVTATNSTGSASSTSTTTGVVAAIAPADTAPPSISGEPVAGLTLRSSTGTWQGSPPLTYSYQWQSCDAGDSECTDIEGATSRSYTLANTDTGRTVRVFVTASNAAGSVTEGSAASSVISPATPPSNTVQPSIAGTAREGQTLLANPGSWEGTSPAFTYQWQSCNPQGTECQDIEGETGETYGLAAGDLGSTVRVIVTATNAAGSAQAISAPTAEVAPGSPTELEAPTITGVAERGETLLAHPGEWGASEVKIGYQWESCNAQGAECQDVLGATGAEYQLGEGDVGTTLRVRILAGNEEASVTALSDPTAVVGTEAPTLTETFAPSVTGTVQSGEVLTADPGSWTGEGEVTYAYEWQRCSVDGSGCEAITGAHGESLALDSADLASAVRVLVTATDANGSLTEPTPVTQPVAAEDAPVIEEAPVVYGTTLEGQTLNATPGTWATEGAPLTYTYQWERCEPDGGACQVIAGANASTHVLVGADVGSTLRVLATAHDHEGEAAAISPATATIAAVSLTAVSAPSITGNTETGHPLSADVGIWTALGPVAYAYQWERCDVAGEECTAISGAHGSSYTPGASDLGDSLRVTIEVTAGEEKATSHSPATAAVVAPDTAPENTLAPSIEGTFTTGDTLTANTGTWAGAEPISYAYQWQSCDPAARECAGIEGATESTYVLGEGDAGGTLRVLVTATNSLASTTAASSTSETVGAPGVPAVGEGEGPTIYGTAKEGAKLFVANGSWSGSRPLSYQYQWERCNGVGEACADIESATKPSYQLQSTDVSATVRVEVTVTNSLGTASAVSPQVAVTVDGQPSAAQAIETAEQTDPSILAPSTSATLEGQQVKPAVTDSGEQLSSESALTASTISKQTTGEFAVNTTAGKLSLEPTGTSQGAATLPTIVNGAAAIYAGSSTDTDTIVRAGPLGATTLLQLRSPQAPTSFSWQVHIGPSQQLEALSDGDVAIVEASSEFASEEGEGEGGEPDDAAPLSTPRLAASPFADRRFSTPLGASEGEGVDGHAAEKEFEESLSEQGSSSALPPSPTTTTGEASPRSGELEPQNTQHEYEAGTSALETATGQATNNVLMVIQAPTVRDAEGHAVPASLSVHDETVTLTLSPTAGEPYPVTAETSVAAPSEQAAIQPELRAFDFDANYRQIRHTSLRALVVL